MTTVDEISSLEELERSWRRFDSLVAVRDWVNGATLLLLVVLLQWSYRDLAWALWTNLIWTSALIIVASVVMRLSGIDRSGHPVGFWLGLVVGSVGVVFGAGILGALLSFFAANEPAALLGPNGFINADTSLVLRHTSRQYAPILLLAFNELVFSVRVSINANVPGSAHLGGYVGKMIGALVLSGLVGVGLAVLFSPAIANVGLAVFYLAWFAFPWRILTKDSIQDQQAEGRPALYAGRLLPLKLSERAGPLMVIITLVLMLMFGGFGFTMFGLGVRQLASYGLSLGSALLVLISLPIIAVFVFLAMLTFTLASSTKRVIIAADRVTIHERSWDSPDKTTWRGRLAATFRSRTLRAALSEYTHLERRMEHHTSSDGPESDEHLLVLKHRTDSEKDVVIYRAVHAMHLDVLRRHYSQLLQIPTTDSNSTRGAS